MNLATISLFLVGIVMGSFGGVMLKKGAVQLPPLSLTLEYVAAVCLNPYIISGFSLYVAPALIWIYLLTKLPISLVQPILALTYVITPILAVIFFGEQVSIVRWIGILVIIAGVVIVSQS